MQAHSPECGCFASASKCLHPLPGGRAVPDIRDFQMRRMADPAPMNAIPMPCLLSAAVRGLLQTARSCSAAGCKRHPAPRMASRLPHPNDGLPSPLNRMPHPMDGLRHPMIDPPHPIVGLRRPADGLPRPIVDPPHRIVGLRHPMIDPPHWIDGLRHPIVDLPHAMNGLRPMALVLRPQP